MYSCFVDEIPSSLRVDGYVNNSGLIAMSDSCDSMDGSLPGSSVHGIL